MALPRYDYDSDDFYDKIFAHAFKGATDKEIAVILGLDEQVFNSMKNGKYCVWNEKQNQERGQRVREVLIRARTHITFSVRSTYLKAALGGKKVRGVTKRYIETNCECKGQDNECPYCQGTGRIVSKDKAIVMETEAETPPNMQALATWLFHHDPEWRKIQRGQDGEEETETSENGISVEKWIEQETRQKDNEDDTNKTNIS